MENITLILKDLLITLAVLGILSAIKIGFSFIKLKINNSKYNDLLGIIIDVVDEVSQTYVSHLKETNSFDEIHQKEALEIALRKIHSLMNDKLSNYIEKNYGDVDTWIINKIESYIWRCDPKKYDSDTNPQVTLFE